MIASGTQHPSVELPSCDPEQLTELVRKAHAWIDVLNRKDVDEIRACYEDDAELLIPPARPVRGARKVGSFFRAVFARYERIEWHVHTIFPINPRVVVYETVSHGAFVNGAAYENRIVSILRYGSSGKIQSLSDYFKDTAIFSQPGMVRT